MHIQKIHKFTVPISAHCAKMLNKKTIVLNSFEYLGARIEANG